MPDPRRRLLRVALAAALLASLAYALVGLASERGSTQPARIAAARPAPVHGLTALPGSALGVVSSTLGAGAHGYRVARTPAGLVAVNRPQGLSATFGTRGARIRSGASELRLGLASLGAPASRVAAPHAGANRATYSLGNLREWYSNGPLGIEQGFTVARAPSRAHGGAPLTVTVPLAGNMRATPAGDDAITFTRAGGPTLSYGHLTATDARGRLLGTWMSVGAGAVLLHVAAHGAAYPLRIDPLIQPGTKVPGTEEAGLANFGVGVAISGNGNYMLVGGPGDDEGKGAIWAFARSGSSWTQLGAKIAPADENGLSQFGYTLALSEEGDTAIIGGAKDNDVGAAWVYTRSGSTWTEQSKLTGGEEVGEGHFGCCAVALSADGNTALVGGYADNASTGAAWVFTRSGSTWSQQGPKLTGGEEVGAGRFGYAVSLSSDGNTALMGGGFDNSKAGAVWVFTRSGSTWSQQGPKLTGSGETGAGQLGFTAALSGDGNTAMAGAGADHSSTGATWTFTRSGSTWTQLGSKLTAAGETGAGHFGCCGIALSSDGKTALIGGYGDNSNAGAAWLYHLSGSTWTQSGSKITGNEQVGTAQFGHGVAMTPSGSRAVIAGPFDNSGVGAVWSFATPGPPTAVTLPATAVAQTSAALNADVTPEGEPVTSCTLEYGTTEAYGSSGPCSPSPGEGVAPVAVSANVAGLSPSTKYHFRVVAKNALGTGTGGDATFTTTASAPPAVTTKPASSVAQTSATLNATVKPEDEPVSECRLEYGTSEAYGSSAPCTPAPGSGTEAVAVSAKVTGLSASTTYHFRVTATNPTGTSHGTDQAFKTAAPQAPAVTTEAANAVAQTSATLNAVVNAEDEPLGECRLEYGTSEAYGSSAPCTPTPSGAEPVAVSAGVSGLSPSTTYHFRVTATNPTGTSHGTDRTFKTTASQPPAVVTKPASAVAQTTATLNATVNPEDEPVSECRFEYGTSEAYGSSAPCTPSPGSGTSPVAVGANIGSLSPNTTYHFRVVATNPIGTSHGADATFKTLVTAPVAVTAPATTIGARSAVLHGTVNPEGEEAVADCHFEYGASESYGTNVPCTPSPGSGSSPVAVSATPTGLTPGTTYHFRVVASNSGGTGTGADAQFTTPAETLPEVGRCLLLTKATGRFKTTACTTLSVGENTGKYEWLPWPAIKNGMSGPVGAMTLETVRKLTILTCTGGSLSGEYNGPRSAAMAITLTGCEGTKTLVGSCHSEGAAPGEVRSAALQSQLGIIKVGTASTVGWVLRPVSGTALASMTCGGTTATLSGSLIGQVTSVNKMSAVFTFKFKGTSGKQVPEKFEGGVKETPTLELPSGNEVAGLSFSVTQSNAEALEIKTNL
ncbi:MAG TPA: hypothetical protein VFW29_04545 [Solirubrobacteraceae bacterium]|nr:hypothetical protein [Solirubrobacteraceae bacterium]